MNASILLASLVLLNIYYFLIKKGCLSQCVSHIAKFNNLPVMYTLHDKSKVRLTLELLIIPYVSNVSLIAITTTLTQFLFTPLVPIMIEMLGLPSWLTFWLYAYMYPINTGAHSSSINPRSSDPKLQHLFLLTLCTIHLLYGPLLNIFKETKIKDKNV